MTVVSVARPRVAQISDSNFKQPSARGLAPPTRVGLLVCLPSNYEGRRSADRRIVNKPRLISRIAGRQHHTATPLGAPPAATSSTLGPDFRAPARATLAIRAGFP